ncbi:hypothetical protein F4703DRAFT_1859586 [Phycomyces blakesleeanus]
MALPYSPKKLFRFFAFVLLAFALLLCIPLFFTSTPPQKPQKPPIQQQQQQQKQQLTPPPPQQQQQQQGQQEQQGNKQQSKPESIPIPHKHVFNEWRWPQFENWLQDSAWSFPIARHHHQTNLRHSSQPLSFIRSLQTYTIQGHDPTALSGLVANKPLVADSNKLDITAIISVHSKQEAIQRINSVLSQSIQPSNIVIVSQTHSSTSIEEYVKELKDPQSASSLLLLSQLSSSSPYSSSSPSSEQQEIQLPPLQYISIDTPEDAPAGSAASAAWLQLLHSVESAWVWAVDTVVPSDELENIYRLMRTSEYEHALVGQRGVLLPANLNKDPATAILCLPDALDLLPRVTQPVDMVQGAWLLKRAWIPYLLADRRPDSLASPVGHFVSQNLLQHANIPTILAPFEPSPLRSSSSVSADQQQETAECLEVKHAFETNTQWQTLLAKRTSPSALDSRQITVRQHHDKHSAVFFADGPEQAIALHPLICRFNQTAHVVVTGHSRGGLGGQALQLAFDHTNCSTSVTIHDLDLEPLDDLALTSAVVWKMTRLIQVIRPQILIHIQNPMDDALAQMASLQHVVAIALPADDVRHVLWIADLSLETLQFWHTIRIQLVVITDRRPHSLSRLLQSSGRAHFLGDKVNLVVHMEQSADRVTKMLVNSFSWHHGEKTIRHRVRKGGLMPAIIESWYPNDNDDYAVLLEDDIEVSPLFYCWSKYAILKYRYEQSNPALYGISLYSPRNLELLPEGRRPFDPALVLEPMHPPRMPYVSQVPCSWGAVYFPEHWREFHDYLTSRIEDLRQEHLLNITVPGSRSDRWKKSWKKYFIELVYLRAYVMLYPNFQHYESFSTNHLEFGTHVKKARLQVVIDNFRVPLMERDTIIDQLPGHRLPAFEGLPVLDLWGRLKTHAMLQDTAAVWHRQVSACARTHGRYDPQDLLCPFPHSRQEIEASLAAAAEAAELKRRLKPVKTKEAVEHIEYVTVYVAPDSEKQQHSLSVEQEIQEQEDYLPKPIDVSDMLSLEEDHGFEDDEMQDLESELDRLNRLYYHVYPLSWYDGAPANPHDRNVYRSDDGLTYY